MNCRMGAHDRHCGTHLAHELEDGRRRGDGAGKGARMPDLRPRRKHAAVAAAEHDDGALLQGAQVSERGWMRRLAVVVELLESLDGWRLRDACDYYRAVRSSGPVQLPGGFLTCADRLALREAVRDT